MSSTSMPNLSSQWKRFYMKTELLVRGYEVKLTIVWLCGERAYSWTTRYRPGSRPVSPFPRHTPQCTSHMSWGTYSHQNMYGFHPRKIYYYVFFYSNYISHKKSKLLKKIFRNYVYRCILYMYSFLLWKILAIKIP